MTFLAWTYSTTTGSSLYNDSFLYDTSNIQVLTMNGWWLLVLYNTTKVKKTENVRLVVPVYNKVDSLRDRIEPVIQKYT